MKSVRNLQNKKSLRSKNPMNENKENLDLNKTFSKKICNTGSRNLFKTFNLLNKDKDISLPKKNTEIKKSEKSKIVKEKIVKEKKDKKEKIPIKIISPPKKEKENEGNLLENIFSSESENYKSEEIFSKEKKDIKVIMANYTERENKILIKNYGAEIYNCMEEMEKDAEIPLNYMAKHKISKDIRTKMVDWMVEVLSVYQCDTETFFLAVFIMDFFIFKSQKIVKTESVHCIGLVSMFIASKFEDLNPLKLGNILHKIGHDIFTEEQIFTMERNILEVISFENLIRTSIHEFIKTYYYDFKYNNKQIISELKIQEDIRKLENLAIYFAKLSCYFDEFYKYNYSLKAVTCIIASFDTYRNAGNLINNKNGEIFFREWILFLIDESEYSNVKINEVYVRLISAHVHYEHIPLISMNLNKYHKE